LCLHIGSDYWKTETILPIFIEFADYESPSIAAKSSMEDNV
jgi:hypothetical protein